MSAGKNIPKMVSMFMYVNQQVALSLISGPSLICRWPYSSYSRERHSRVMFKCPTMKVTPQYHFPTVVGGSGWTVIKLRRTAIFHKLNSHLHFYYFYTKPVKPCDIFSTFHILFVIFHILYVISPVPHTNIPPTCYFLADLEAFLDFEP